MFLDFDDRRQHKAVIYSTFSCIYSRDLFRNNLPAAIYSRDLILSNRIVFSLLYKIMGRS